MNHKKSNPPPRIAQWLLKYIFPDRGEYTSLGDFEEVYNQIAARDGVIKARLWFWAELIKSLPDFFKNQICWSLTMFKNYLKIAFRNILKHKVYSFINITGLAIGIACSILIFLWVKDELSYDRYHEKAEQIYRLVFKGRIGNADVNYPHSPSPMGNVLVKEFPEVLQSTKLLPTWRVVIHYKEKHFNEEHLFFTDSSIFDLFTFPLIQGDPKTALTQPNSIVITKSAAKKYFGDENPMGKKLKLGDNATYEITGIAKDVPQNSHFHFNCLASIITLNVGRNPDWADMEYYTYIVLQKGYSKARLEAKFPGMIRKYLVPRVLDGMGISYDEFLSKGNSIRFLLQPLIGIHLHSHLEGELEANTDVKYIYIFSIIALFILIIACINFMNLATARFAERSKEVGIRKVLGSIRSQLVGQFLVESIMLSFFAVLLAIFLIECTLPFFNNFTGKQLDLRYLSNWFVLPAFICTTLFVGIVAGSYPAFFLASFKPIKVLKGPLNEKIFSRTPFLRNILVVFQFSISIILLVGTFVVSSQMEYVRDKELGFTKNNVVVITGAEVIGQQREAFKNELLQDSNVFCASASFHIPGKAFSSYSFEPEGVPGDAGNIYQLKVCQSDFDYVRTLKLKMAEGRFFSCNHPNDANSIIINESAARRFGWKDPVGKRISSGNRHFTVIGVIKNFHFESLHQEIRPLVILHLRENPADYISVRINTENIKKTLAFLENKWKKFVPDRPFDYFFLEDGLNKLYSQEKRSGQLFGIFCTLAVFIACLGLFGLASFTAEQKTKEIGVRKVLGANGYNIVLLLTKEFTKWIITANVVAWPIAYFVMNKWLQNFAYRTNMRISIFILSGLLAFVIALITVSYQSIKAAIANPVDTLKYE
jgi:putative ABC transport system permease protein